MVQALPPAPSIFTGGNIRRKLRLTNKRINLQSHLKLLL
jgi:hypothetical protein